MRRIAVTNQKGGVGKTTTVANLGAALAGRGQRMLLVDLDPQAHLTLNFGADPTDRGISIDEVLTDSAAVAEATVEVRPNLHLVPSHTDLVAAESELIGVVGRELILRDALAAVGDDFDIMLIDCPPSLGVLSLNALAAAQEVLIPLQPHFLALQGLAKLLETISLVQARINAGLRVAGALLCLHESGTRLANEVVENLRAFLETARDSGTPWADARLFDTRIRRNIKLAECPSHGLTIFDYAPRCHGAQDYRQLAAELLGELAPTAPAAEATALGAAPTASAAEPTASADEAPAPGPEPTTSGAELMTVADQDSPASAIHNGPGDADEVCPPAPVARPEPESHPESVTPLA